MAFAFIFLGLECSKYPRYMDGRGEYCRHSFPGSSSGGTANLQDMDQACSPEKSYMAPVTAVRAGKSMGCRA